jgi:hypothetical protein
MKDQELEVLLTFLGVLEYNRVYSWGDTVAVRKANNISTLRCSALSLSSTVTVNPNTNDTTLYCAFPSGLSTTLLIGFYLLERRNAGRPQSWLKTSKSGLAIVIIKKIFLGRG